MNWGICLKPIWLPLETLLDGIRFLPASWFVHKKMVVASIRLIMSPELAQQLDDVATLKGITCADVFR